MHQTLKKRIKYSRNELNIQEMNKIFKKWIKYSRNRLNMQ